MTTFIEKARFLFFAISHSSTSEHNEMKGEERARESERTLTFTVWVSENDKAQTGSPLISAQFKVLSFFQITPLCEKKSLVRIRV